MCVRLPGRTAEEAAPQTPDQIARLQRVNALKAAGGLTIDENGQQNGAYNGIFDVAGRSGINTVSGRDANGSVMTDEQLANATRLAQHRLNAGAPADATDIFTRDLQSGRVRRARAGSTRNSLIGSFDPMAPLGPSSLGGR